MAEDWLDDDDDDDLEEAAANVADQKRGQRARRARMPFGRWREPRAIRGLLKVGDYLTTNSDKRTAKGNREGIHFHIGRVLRHRKFGFRAVVFGWGLDRIST